MKLKIGNMNIEVSDTPIIEESREPSLFCKVMRYNILNVAEKSLTKLKDLGLVSDNNLIVYDFLKSYHGVNIIGLMTTKLSNTFNENILINYHGIIELYKFNKPEHDWTDDLQNVIFEFYRSKYKSKLNEFDVIMTSAKIKANSNYDIVHYIIH